MIELDCLTKQTAPGFALRDIDLQVPKGSTLALFGPSGCGKTTTLRLIAGFERPDSGSIRINGNTVASGRVNLTPHKRGVAMVFQDLALWPHMTVQRHLTFVLEGRVKGRGAIVQKVEDMLARIALSAKAASYPHQLSGGERQRLAMARALITEPAVLLMDEPLSSLDARLRSALLREIKQLIRTHGITTIYVTHDWHEAVFLADRIAMVDGGRITRTIAANDPEAVRDHDTVWDLPTCRVAQ